MRGVSAVSILVQSSANRGDDFVGTHGVHATKVDGAFAQEARTAFNVMTNHSVRPAERPGQPMFRRTKNRNDRYAEQRREVHRAGVVSQQKATLAKFVDQIVYTR
jgi:hypothetical protein